MIGWGRYNARRSGGRAEPATCRKGARAGPGGDVSMEGAEARAREEAAVSRDLLALG